MNAKLTALFATLTTGGVAIGFVGGVLLLRSIPLQSPVNWNAQFRALARRQGNAERGTLGGDRRTARIEAQAALIRQLVAETRTLLPSRNCDRSWLSAATGSATARSSGFRRATG